MSAEAGKEGGGRGGEGVVIGGADGDIRTFHAAREDMNREAGGTSNGSDRARGSMTAAAAGTKFKSDKQEILNKDVETSSFAPSNAWMGFGATQEPPKDPKNVPAYFHKFENVLGHVNQYILFEEVGRGAQGAVYKSFNKEDKRDYAIKCLERASLKRKRKRTPGSGGNITMLKNEIEVMKQLDHPNLVKLYEVIDDVENDRLYLVMDFVQGGSVMGDNDVLNCKDPLSIAIPEAEACRLFFDFCLGMEHLHTKGILHRDIKPSNMLIDVSTADGVPRCQVCDFGVSTLCDERKSAKLLGEDDLVFAGAGGGTISMMSPEALGAGPDAIYHGRPADVWSAGVTLFVMLTGSLPFKAKEGEGMDVLMTRIKEDPIMFPNKPKISNKAKNLIRKMLDKDPQKRITFSILLRDSWFGTMHKQASSFSSAESIPTQAISAAGTDDALTDSSDVRARSRSGSGSGKMRGSRGSPRDSWFANTLQVPIQDIGRRLTLGWRQKSNELDTENEEESTHEAGGEQSQGRSAAKDSDQDEKRDFLERLVKGADGQTRTSSLMIDSDQCEKNDFLERLVKGADGQTRTSSLMIDPQAREELMAIARAEQLYDKEDIDPEGRDFLERLAQGADGHNRTSHLRIETQLPSEAPGNEQNKEEDPSNDEMGSAVTDLREPTHLTDTEEAEFIERLVRGAESRDMVLEKAEFVDRLVRGAPSRSEVLKGKEE